MILLFTKKKKKRVKYKVYEINQPSARDVKMLEMWAHLKK